MFPYLLQPPFLTSFPVSSLRSRKCSETMVQDQDLQVAPSSFSSTAIHMEGSVQVMALNANSMTFGSTSAGAVFEAVNCMISFVRTTELVNAALELLVLTYAGSKAMVLLDQDVEHTKEYIVGVCPPKSPQMCHGAIHMQKSFAYTLFQSAHARSAMHIDPLVSTELNARNQAPSMDEMERSSDESKACARDMLLHGPNEGPESLSCGSISDWTSTAAKGKDEVNTNRSRASKPVSSGKDNDSNEDEDEDEDDFCGQEEGESGDEQNNDGEEGEDDGNEDDDDDEEEDEEEEEDDEENEEAVPIPSAQVNLARQNEEEEDDSDEGEREEEGVDEEDDFGEEGEDEDGEDDEEDEEDEEEVAPEPPRKKNKSS